MSFVEILPQIQSLSRADKFQLAQMLLEDLAKEEPATKNAAPAEQVRQLGTMKGTVLYIAPDFDAPLEDFEEYMK